MEGRNGRELAAERGVERIHTQLSVQQEPKESNGGAAVSVAVTQYLNDKCCAKSRAEEAGASEEALELAAELAQEQALEAGKSKVSALFSNKDELGLGISDHAYGGLGLEERLAVLREHQARGAILADPAKCSG